MCVYSEKLNKNKCDFLITSVDIIQQRAEGGPIGHSRGF